MLLFGISKAHKNTGFVSVHIMESDVQTRDDVVVLTCAKFDFPSTTASQMRERFSRDVFWNNSYDYASTVGGKDIRLISNCF